jgi:hypothetical protein
MLAVKKNSHTQNLTQTFPATPVLCNQMDLQGAKGMRIFKRLFENAQENSVN